MAQNNLATMHQLGWGVPQDKVIAHMWCNLAAANGYELTRGPSVTNRDLIAKQMTPAAIEKAQAMARECMSSGYTKCGD